MPPSKLSFSAAGISDDLSRAGRSSSSESSSSISSCIIDSLVFAISIECKSIVWPPENHELPGDLI